MKGPRLYLHANMLFLFSIHDDGLCTDIFKINFIVYLGGILSIWEKILRNTFCKYIPGIIFYYYFNNLSKAILLPVFFWNT